MRAFTVDDMKLAAGEAWGAFGVGVVDLWAEFNAAYFDNALRPIPIVLTQAQPFGRALAFCSWGNGRTITLNVPKDHSSLVADANTLLHEMIHQCLFERGEYPSHDGQPWRREIMRLTNQITGAEIWAGPSKTMRENGRVVRRNAAHPETGMPSLRQMQIACWPHGLGINLGPLDGHTT